MGWLQKNLSDFAAAVKCLLSQMRRTSNAWPASEYSLQNPSVVVFGPRFL
jgi:hypothetical protein